MSIHTSSVPDLENRPYQDTIVDTIFRAFVSHLEENNLLTRESISKRRLSELESHVKNVARMKDVSKKDTSHLVDQSALIDQAMGSGKTIVLARILDRIMRFRDRYMSEQPLRVLVVTDRISTVDQLHDDFMLGRGAEVAPFVSARVRESIHHAILHSQAQQNTNRGLTQVSEGSQTKKDEVVFSTIQSAEKLIGEKKFDIIIVDEADASIRMEGNYLPVLEELAKSSNIDGVKPFIIGATGTVDRETESIFGPAQATYTLTEYLMSGYAPDISYHLMTHPRVTEEEIQLLHQQILEIQQYGNIAKKRVALKEFRQKLDQILLGVRTPEELAAHMHEHIDLGAKSIVFTPSIRDAKDMTAALNTSTNSRGVAEDIHSQSDQTDSAILSRFRDPDDSLSILVGVDKLNRGIDLPACENLVFLRDTGSKKIFSQQLARGLRGERTTVYDYVVNLSNLVYLYDIQERSARQTGAYRGGGEGGSSKIQLFFSGRPIAGDDGDDSSSRGVDFYTLCGLYLDEHRKYDIVELGTTPEMVADTLSGYGIVDYETLREFGSVKFMKTFGIGALGFLFKKIKKIGYCTKDDLYNLALWLRWTAPANLPSKGMNKKELLALLETQNITNYESLKKFGPKKLAKILSVSDLGKILRRNILKIVRDDLYNLALWLGWTVPEHKPSADKIEKVGLPENQESIIVSFSEYGITDYDSLIKFGSVKLNKTFNTKVIRTFIGKKGLKNTMLLDDLYNLAVLLGWKVPKQKPSETGILGKTKSEIIANLATYAITDYVSLQEFGRERFSKIFRASNLYKILNKKGKASISRDILYDLAVYLGWKVPKMRPGKITTIEDMAIFLKSQDIIDYESLIKFGGKSFKKAFGVTHIGSVLKRTLHAVTREDLYDLSVLLKWEVPDRRPTYEREVTLSDMKDSLSKLHITDYETLKGFGVTKFHTHFSKVPHIRKILNKKGTGNINYANLYDLAVHLGWEVPPERPSEKEKR